MSDPQETLIPRADCKRASFVRVTPRTPKAVIESIERLAPHEDDRGQMIIVYAMLIGTFTAGFLTHLFISHF